MLQPNNDVSTNECNLIRSYVQDEVNKHYFHHYGAIDSAYTESVRMVENVLSSDLDSCLQMDIFLRKANSSLKDYSDLLVLNGYDLIQNEINVLCDSINFILEESGYSRISSDDFINTSEEFVKSLPLANELATRIELRSSQSRFLQAILQLKYRLTTIDANVSSIQRMAYNLNVQLTQAIVMKFVCKFKLKALDELKVSSEHILEEEGYAEADYRLLDQKLNALNEVIIRLELSQKTYANLAEDVRIVLDFVQAQDNVELNLKKQVLLS